MSEIKFGTDGWRAVLDEVFNEENVVRVAEAFVRFLNQTLAETKPVAVGFDGRRDSRRYATIFSTVLSAHNISVLLSPAIIPTPVLSFAVKRYGCSAGVMITASHNPSQYNGIKFKGSYGGPFMSEQTHIVEELLRETIEGRSDDARVHETDFMPDYLAQLQSLIDVDALRRFASVPSRQASLIIDSMGGAGQTILEDILTPLGWRAQTIFGTAEADFYDRSPEPIERNLGPLLYNTGVTDALLGIATDGDADRCSIVYDNGTWMTAQENILALIWHLHTNKQWRGAVIKSASVTDKARMLAQRWEEKVFDVGVGFKHITEMMLKEDFMLGAEESGGFGFKNHMPERDGILSGLMFCEMIAVSGKSLRQIMQEISAIVGELSYGRIDVPYGSPDRGTILPRLAGIGPPATVGGFPILSVRTYTEGSTLTGVKFVLGNSRWMLIRTSQTEPLVRIYAEGQRSDEVKGLLSEGRRLAGI